jgi:hypothetical protein
VVRSAVLGGHVTATIVGYPSAAGRLQPAACERSQRHPARGWSGFEEGFWASSARPPVMNTCEDGPCSL